MSIDPNTSVREVRRKIVDFVQAELAMDGHIAIGSFVMFETMGADGVRTLVKITTSSDGESPLPVWTQDGFLASAGDHDGWGEWNDFYQNGEEEEE